MIHLARSLDLPADAVTQKFAILARSGAGKTYTGTKLCEEMLALPAQVVVLDPVGVWYGLRLDANGKSAGAGIPVLGGAHGDVPLLPTTGAAVARLVVEHHLSVVLDVSEMRKGQRATFITAFAEELFHLKKTHRSPMHIFIEEAQTFVPQRVQHGEERMLGALEDICRLGRNYGIGNTLISQRPQSVNKEVLNQAECLIALQTNGPQERKAIEGWVSEKRLGKEIIALIDELPSLEIGQAFVWSPQWLKKFVRVKILKKNTFDASATPEVGSKSSIIVVPSINIDELRAALDTELKAAAANDPAELRKKLAAAEKALANRAPTTTSPMVLARPRREDAALIKSLQRGLEAAMKIIVKITAQDFIKDGGVDSAEIQKALEAATAGVTRLLEMKLNQREKDLAGLQREAQKIVATLKSLVDTDIEVEVGVKHNEPFTVAPRETKRAYDKRTGTTRHTVTADGSGLRRGAREMLRALGRMSCSLTRRQVATLAGLAPTSGTFSTYLGDLRSGGYIVEDGGLLSITERGRDVFPDAERDPLPPSTGELIGLWSSKLRAGARSMLDVLVETYPREVSRAELAERAGLVASSGTFSTYLGDLTGNGLAERTRDGVKASPSLFMGA